MSISSARIALAESLEGQGYLVFPSPLENMPVPSIVLVPANPYVRITTTGGRLDLGFKATLMVAAIDNQASILQLEDLMTKFLDALPLGVGIGDFSSPALTQVGPTDYLTTDIEIHVSTTQE